MNKKLISLVLAAALMILPSCGKDTSDLPYSGQTLKLFTWGEYTGDNLINDFKKQTGANVIIEYFDSNEMMYTKISAGDKYDVIIPSDYTIERMIKEDMLMEIDKSKITNYSELAEGVKNLPFDPENKYSIPYFWGSVGILYNHNNVPQEIVEEKGYSIFKDTAYKDKIYVYDSERDSFMIALKALGYSMNSTNDAEINEAYEWLVELNNTMKPTYVTDEVIDGMINGSKDLAVVYSGDATVVLEENADMSFSMPKEGTNIWCDSMVIPKNAENPELAHEFINFVLSYDASYDNSETCGYASANQKVLEDMSTEGGLYCENGAFLPRAGYDKDETFEYNEVMKRKLSDLWLKVKVSK